MQSEIHLGLQPTEEVWTRQKLGWHTDMFIAINDNLLTAILHPACRLFADRLKVFGASSNSTDVGLAGNETAETSSSSPTRGSVFR